MSRASDLLALANLNKRDRYIDKSIAANFQQKRDWKWVGFDSTTGQGVVQSGNLTRRGKVITNGAIVPGEVVAYSQDGEFGIIEGKPYARPQPRANPQYVPVVESVKKLKVFYERSGVGSLELHVGGWQDSSVKIDDLAPLRGRVFGNTGGGDTIPFYTHFENAGADLWNCGQIIRTDTGLNAASFPIYNVSIRLSNQAATSDLTIYTGYEPVSGDTLTRKGMHFAHCGGGYTIIDNSTSIYNASGTTLTQSGDFLHLYNGAITTTTTAAQTYANTGGINFLDWGGARPKSYYMIPPSSQLATFDVATSAIYPVVTNGQETFAFEFDRTTSVKQFYLYTTSGRISIPPLTWQLADQRGSGDSGSTNNSIFFPGTLINGILYRVLLPLDGLGLFDQSSIVTSNPGETGTLTLRAHDLVAGTFTDTEEEFYKIYDVNPVTIVGVAYHPD
jgi:hypothetical protein